MATGLLAGSFFYVTQRKGASRRKHHLTNKISHACVSRGAAVAAGMLFSAGCVTGAGPAQGAPRSSSVVEVSPVPQLGPLRYYTIAEMKEQGWLGPPIGRLDDHDLPEPDATFYTSGVFAGTAVTGTARRAEPDLYG